MTDSLPATPSSEGSSAVQPLPRSITPDDLLTMYDEEAKASSDEVAKEVDKQAKVAEELPKKLAANELVKKLEQKDSAANPGEDDDGGEARSDGSADGEKKAEEVEKPADAPKAFKAKLGDAEVDIPEAAAITVKVDGKDVAVTVADAVKAFQTQTEFNRGIDRRLGFVDSKEKQLKSQYEDIKTRAQTITQLARQGDWIPVIRTLAKMAAGKTGNDPIAIEKECIESLEKVHEVYTKMTPEQRDVYFAKRRAEHAEQDAAELRKQNERTTAQQQIEKEIGSLQKQHGIGDEQFWNLYQVLSAHEVGDGKKFGTIEEITPQDVVAFHGDVQHIKKVEDAIGKVSAELVDDGDFCREVFEITRNHPEFDVSDIEAVVRTALAEDTTSIGNLNRKVAKGKSETLRAQLGGASPKTEEKSAIDEELEETFFNYSKRDAALKRFAAQR